MENEERLVVLNKYGNPVDANIVKGALEAAGIPAGVIGDSLANHLWREAIRVVVFRSDLEEAINVLYGGEMHYEDFQEDMDRPAFENLQACNQAFCELALKLHPEIGGKGCKDVYNQARQALEEGDLQTLNSIRGTLS